jgi:acyl carrier protein
MSLPSVGTAQTELREWLCAHLSAELRVPQAAIDPDQPMVDYGLDSLTAAGILMAVEQRVGFEVDPNALWDYPTVASFADFLADQIASGA